MPRSIEELERRVQIEQDALSVAVITGNPVAQAVYREGVARAERALRAARIRLGEH